MDKKTLQLNVLEHTFYIFHTVDFTAAFISI